MNKNNVISMADRLKRAKSKGFVDNTKGQAPIVDMTERRQEILSDERRKVKRTLLTEFIGACVVVPNKGLMKVAIHDISDGGVSFDLEGADGAFKENEEVAMRVYKNQETYFPFIVTIQNIRLDNEYGILRHGAHFVKGTLNKEALHHFVKFIETVSASLERDSGDVMVSNLKD